MMLENDNKVNHVTSFSGQQGARTNDDRDVTMRVSQRYVAWMVKHTGHPGRAELVVPSWLTMVSPGPPWWQVTSWFPGSPVSHPHRRVVVRNMSLQTSVRGRRSRCRARWNSSRVAFPCCHHWVSSELEFTQQAGKHGKKPLLVTPVAS